MPTNFHTPYLDFELLYNQFTLQHLNDNGGKFDADNSTKMTEILVAFDERSMQIPLFLMILTAYARLHNIAFDQIQQSKPLLSSQALSLIAQQVTTSVYQKIIIDAVTNAMRKKDLYFFSSIFHSY